MGVFTPQKLANAGNQPAPTWLLPHRAGLPSHPWAGTSCLQGDAVAKDQQTASHNT